MKLYEFGPTRAIRVRWALQELGVEFESVVVDLRKGENRRPEFLKINPAGKLPVLVDGDFVLTESAAIVWYLGEKYAAQGLIPRDLRQRAQVQRWMLFAVTELEQPIWRIVKHTRLYAEGERQPGDVPLAGRDFEQMASVLDEHMKERRFVVGDAATIADFVTAYTLDMATAVAAARIWDSEAGLLAKFPGLVSYMERMYARPHAPLRIKEAFAAIAAQ